MAKIIKNDDNDCDTNLHWDRRQSSNIRQQTERHGIKQQTDNVDTRKARQIKPELPPNAKY